MTADAADAESLLTSLERNGFIHAGEPVVFKTSEGDEHSGTITRNGSTLVISFNNETFVNTARFVRAALKSQRTPKNFNNSITVGGRAFRDVLDAYHEKFPRPTKPKRESVAATTSSSSAAAAAAAPAAARGKVRLAQLVRAELINIGDAAWFEGPAGKFTATVDRRPEPEAEPAAEPAADGAKPRRRRAPDVGFVFKGQWLRSASAFVRAAQEGVPEDKQINTRQPQSAVHIGQRTLADIIAQFNASRPAPAVTAAPSNGNVDQQLRRIRERRATLHKQLTQLDAEEKALLGASGAGEKAARRPGRPRRRRGPRKDAGAGAPSQ